MKIGQRVLLVTYSLLVMAIVVLFALVVCGFLGTDTTVEFIKSISGNLLYTCSIIIIALALIVFSFCMMFLGTNKRENSTVIKSTDNGSIRISIDTVNTIAAKAVKGVAGVRDAKVNAANTADPNANQNHMSFSFAAAAKLRICRIDQVTSFLFGMHFNNKYLS